MKPFLILQLRPNDDAANGEFQAFLKHGGLSEKDVVRIRMEKAGIPEINLDDYSGVIVGGGPSNISDPEEKKSDEQKRFEKDLQKLLEDIFDRDFPYLGACYGLGALAEFCGGDVSKEKFSEDVGPVTITLTKDGEKDPLTAGLPKSFWVFLGHKEACQNIPTGIVNLASSEECPHQMFRLKTNIYATQFHPELDVEGIVTRINVYKHHGYFPPEDAEVLMEKCKQEKVTVPPKILKRFIETYRQS